MPTIMLIEDDLTMLSLLSTLLQMEGFQVSSAKDEELENVFLWIKQEKPPLVLVDVNLHLYNGCDLLDKIRADAGLSETRVIMSSGMDYKDLCLQHGADDFILKPYMPDDLINKIRLALSMARN